MKSLFILILTINVLACVSSKNNIHSVATLEIIKTDSIRDHFVFKTKSKSGKEIIVLAEKDSVNNCRPFKKFILSDSVHQTSELKSGSKKDLVGFYLSTIDGIKIRDEGELVKIIWNCNCFTDK
jgi:hypothetical protein